MAGDLGMRAKDVRIFCMVAQKYNIYILVRQTNPASLAYVGQPGYYPKPAAIKAKTADKDPSGSVASQAARYKIAGLVPHPWFHPAVYSGDKLSSAQRYWLDTLDIALSPGCNIPRADPHAPATWKFWGADHLSARTGWRWKIDVDPASQHFGCLQIARDGVAWSYVHGDYDLKDVIVSGAESINQRVEGSIHGVKNYTPLLRGMEFETIQNELNERMGIAMVQHGSEAQFAGHGDEAIVLILPDGPNLQYQVLGNAEAVQVWYKQLNRQLIANNGKDYLGDKTRWFHFGDHGDLFMPGMFKSD